MQSTLLVLALLFATIACVSPAQAQPEHRLLVQFGLANASQSFSETGTNSSSARPTYESRTRFSLGLGYGLKTGRFAFSAEVNYAALGAREIVKATNVLLSGGTLFTETVDLVGEPTFEYVEVPLQFGFYAVDESKFRLRIMAGPWVGFGLGGEQTITGTISLNGPSVALSQRISQSSTIMVDGEYRQGEVRMNPFQFGLLGGVGLEYAITDRISLSLEPRYMIGLSDITPDPPSSSVDQSIYHRVFSAMLRLGVQL